MSDTSEIAADEAVKPVSSGDDTLDAAIAAMLGGEIEEKADNTDSENEEVIDQADTEDALETEEGDTDESESEEAEPYKLENLAKQLGVEASDVYSIEVPIADGETVTIGELKDGYKDAIAVNAERETLEGQRIQQQKEQMQARDQLSKLVDMLGAANIPDEYWQEIERLQHQEVVAAGQAMVSAIPDWKNAEAAQADLASMGEHLSKWGFTAADLGNVTDSRLMVYIRDNMRKEALAEQAKERLKRNQKPAKSLASKKVDGKKAAHARLHKLAKSGNRQAQNELGTALLEEAGLKTR